VKGTLTLADKSDRKHKQAGRTLSQLEADAEAIEAKTARLRALRLAHEASMGTTPARSAPSATVKRAGKASKKASATLAEWLAAQKNEGRRS
jgi:hypothetical protein